ncbi:hypothetical protein [Spirillospora sp. NBC_01491]|uniref:hypothetical protein n=1 Tax=Spirillospora sp. NBC_01491 TaxID=2976007 RepID=UPI002E341296|nr:hypothetical protein [Spirillospora sp. NBC_01491]
MTEDSAHFELPPQIDYLDFVSADGQTDWDRLDRVSPGLAGDVPTWLEQMGDADPTVAGKASEELWNRLQHQGSMNDPAPATVPALVRLAADPNVHDRPGLLYLLGRIGRSYPFQCHSREELMDARVSDEERYTAYGQLDSSLLRANIELITRAAHVLTGLLSDPDPKVRVSAAYAVAVATRDTALVTAALRAQYEVENDPLVQAYLVLAVAQLAIADGDTIPALAWAENVIRDDRAAAIVRLGAAIALLCLTDDTPDDGLLAVLAETITPETTRLFLESPWGDTFNHDGGLPQWVISLLDADAAAQVDLATRLFDSPHVTIRIAACYMCANRCMRCCGHTLTPSLTEQLTALLTERLHDDDPAVHEAAASALTRLREPWRLAGRM